MRYLHFLILVLLINSSVKLNAQLPVGLDTITVLENSKVLRSPWAGGLNFCEFSQVDLDLDGKNDIVAFDKTNYLSYGVLRCFLNKGGAGQINYVYDGSYMNKFPPVSYWAFFYDYDMDGKADLFTYVLGGIQVYKNTSTPGNLSFQLKKYRIYSNSNPLGAPILVNIYSSQVSLPGFVDADKDGDMDILTFSSTGFQIEYHKNKSMELYGIKDSLVYELADFCWGDISESGCGVSLNQCPLMKLYNMALENSSKAYHSGACLMCFDRDSDGDLELILGDISCSYVNYLENAGTGSSNSHMVDTTKLYPNYPAKASTQIIRMNSFPCTYNFDVDNDGKKDLIASPNVSGGENYQSVWYYNNNGSPTTANFQFVKNNFLQDEMIEVGEGAYPVLFDNDNDGLKDLVIGNLGYYNGNSNQTKLTFYKNVGSFSQPSYSLVTRDFANLTALTATVVPAIGSMVPTFGDIDGDGDIDMVLGDSYGRIHWVENIAGFGNTCNFNIFKFNAFSISTASTSSHAYPQLIDVNRDGLLDLITGRHDGSLYYYRNNGTFNIPSFSLITKTFGGVNVKGDPSFYGGDGSCAPFMYDVGGNYKLLCGSISGRIFLYDNIDGNLTGNFNRVDTNVNKIFVGMQSAVQYMDITGDGKRDLLVGNYAGGLNYFSSNKSVIGIEELTNNNDENILVYPNPANDFLYVKCKDFNVERCEIELMDLCGKIILKQTNNDSYCYLNTATIAKGVYMLKINTRLNKHIQSIYKKIILQ